MVWYILKMLHFYLILLHLGSGYLLSRGSIHGRLTWNKSFSLSNKEVKAFNFRSFMMQSDDHEVVGSASWTYPYTFLAFLFAVSYSFMPDPLDAKLVNSPQVCLENTGLDEKRLSFPAAVTHQLEAEVKRREIRWLSTGGKRRLSGERGEFSDYDKRPRYVAVFFFDILWTGPSLHFFCISTFGLIYVCELTFIWQRAVRAHRLSFNLPFGFRWVGSRLPDFLTLYFLLQSTTNVNIPSPPNPSHPRPQSTPLLNKCLCIP